MERLNLRDRKGLLHGRFASYLTQAGWEVARYRRTFTRRFGRWGWSMMLCGTIGIGAWVSLLSLENTSRLLQEPLANSNKVLSPALTQEPLGSSPLAEDRLRLLAFEDHLLDHDDIPVVVQDLLNLAEDQGLSMQRGDYRAYVDPVGGFLRYRMTLPIKGDATSIYRFMRLALQKQRNLALSSVQFKRERIDSSEIEANIHWVILTRLPAGKIKTEDSAGGAL